MLTQENDKLSTARISWVAGAFLLLSPVLAQAADGPDPILAGPAPGPCAAQAVGADYVDGVDASGNPVTPAGGPSADTGMGDGTVLVTVPRAHGRDVSVPVHLADLAPPTCNPQPARSPH